MSNNELDGLAPGDVVGDKGDKILMECGCCKDSVIDIDLENEFIKIKDEDASFCDGPICTPQDVDWEPCDDGKSKKKKNDEDDEGQDLVKTIQACIYYDDGTFEEKCVDPFYIPKESEDDIIDVVCGSCPTV